tara:strand:+ start:68 stop:1159 length:1092 start_codon:yes stop_codon:yes gene_type:complete
MKHKITTFLFLFTLGFSFNLITPTDSKAGAYSCAKDPDGAIIVQRLGANMFNLTTGDPANQCSEEPDFYKVLIYKIALCKEDPYTAGGALPDYSSCAILDEDFTKTDADATIIQPGIETSLNISDFLIPVGSYPYASLVVSTKIKVKHNQTFSGLSALATNNGLRGFDADLTDVYDSNEFCWSLAKVTTLHNTAYAAGHAYVTAHGLGQAVLRAAQTPATVSMDCGPTAGTAAYATEMIDDMRDEGDDFVSFSNYADVSEDTGIAGIDLAVLLLEDEATISDSATNSKLLSVNYRYATPIIITEQTVKLDIRIKTSSAISLDFSYEGDNAQGKTIWADKVGANAFTTTIRTKDRRAGRIGSWR